MRTRNLLFVFVVLSLMIASCAPPAVDMAALRATIDEYNAATSESMMTNDIEKVMPFYADDAIQLPDKAPANKGKEAIRAWITEMSSMGMKFSAATFTPTEVNAAGNIAYEIGEYSMTMSMEGMPEMSDNGKYVAIWKQQTDGSWKVYAEIWNSSVAPPMDMGGNDMK
ncbi:MAG TPA: DUF4440 domain-containing protein [Bacteroidota bacterium]